MLRFSFLISILLLFAINLPTFGQRASSDKTNYSYFRKPLTKTPEANRSYSVSVNIPFAESYFAEMAAFDEANKKADEEYEVDRKAADEEYAAALEAYNDQGAGAKILSGILLDDDGKPEKRYVERRYIPEPQIRNDIPSDGELMSGIDLQGFNKVNSGGYTIAITMPNYIVIEKEAASNEKWYKTATIKIPMDVRVTDQNGQQVMQISSQLADNVLTYSTQKMDRPSYDQFMNTGGYSSWLDAQKMTARNLIMADISNQLNSELGYGWNERIDPIYTAKGKKLDYSALDKASLQAQQGLQELSINEDNAKGKLTEAIATWNEELGALDLVDKKARVNNKVGAGIYINLALIHIILEDFDKADEYLNTVQGNDAFKGGDQREAEDLRNFLNEQRRRA
ncbi:MAG: hypothetical protein HQ500_02260 [Flavobacteriales bacterium]|nr:hypothetical protein [Flavobacteriales bacterium]